MAEKKKRNLTPEGREALKRNWEEQHAVVVVDPETGVERRKVGGPQPGSGRPRKRPVESLEEWADDNQQTLVEALTAGLSETSPPAERRRSATNIMELLRKEEHDKAQERRGLEQAERDAILGSILRGIDQRFGGGAEEVLDGDAAELVDGSAERDPGSLRELEQGEGAAE